MTSMDMSPISETDLILNPDGSVYHLNLLPKHISDIIITVGDPDRVQHVSKYFDVIDFQVSKREFISHIGRLNGKQLTVISTGMGTDNIEILFTELDALVNVDLKTRLPKKEKKVLKIVRIGTSGSLQKDIPLDSHLVSAYAVGLDNLMHFYNLQMDAVEEKIAKHIQAQTNIDFIPYVIKGSVFLQALIGEDMIVGNTVTTPGFYAPQGRIIRLPLRYPSLLEKLNGFYDPAVDFRLTNLEMETAGYYALARMLGHEALSVNAIVADRNTKKFSSNANATMDSLIRKVLSKISS